MAFDRRETLRLLAGLTAAPLLAPRPGHAALPELPAPPTLPARRPEPGLVEMELDARPAEVTVAGQRARLLTYGGTFPGPVLRAREGETVRLRFTNRLAEPTNLHFHGMHIPPTGNADNIWLEIPPGETFTYEFTIPEGEAGTYWYHPHFHGLIARQLWAGMAGAIVVESPLDASPELAGADDRVVVLKDIALAGGRPAPHLPLEWMKGKEGALVLVNGVERPRLTARAGTVRLRLINASNARYFRIGLDEGRPLYLIATDGHFLDRPVAVAEVLLTPAERADVLIRFEEERPIRLLNLSYDRRAAYHRGPTTLMTLMPPLGAKPLPLPGRPGRAQRLVPGVNSRPHAAPPVFGRPIAAAGAGIGSPLIFSDRSKPLVEWQVLRGAPVGAGFPEIRWLGTLLPGRRNLDQDSAARWTGGSKAHDEHRPRPSRRDARG